MATFIQLSARELEWEKKMSFKDGEIQAYKSMIKMLIKYIEEIRE